MYRSRWRSLSASKKFCAASCVRVCKSPQKLSCNSATKCWKCSVIGIIFAMGVGLLFWNGFSLRGQSQLTPSCFLHNRIYVTPGPFHGGNSRRTGVEDSLRGLRRRLVAQGIHELADLMALAFRFLYQFFVDLVAGLEFDLRLGGIPDLTIGLGEAKVRLFHLGIRLNGSLVVGNRPRIILLLGMENAQLKVRGTELRIETNHLS